MSTLRVDTLESTDGEYSFAIKDLLAGGQAKASQIVAQSSRSGNTVEKTVLERLDYQIFAADYGAIGDMATDCGDAINNALADAAAFGFRGAEVILPAGIFNTSVQIVIPKYVRLRGAGRFTTLIRCTKSGSDVNPALSMPNDQASLVGVGVVYSTLQTTAGTCIKTTGASNILLDTYSSAGYIGHHWHTGSATIIDGVTIADCKYVGILYGESISGTSNDLIVRNFFILTSVQTNFSLGGMRAIGHLEAIFADTGDIIGGTYPFTSDPGTTDGLRFSGFTNVFFDSGTYGARFKGVNNTSLVGCWFSNREIGADFEACFNIDISAVKAWNNTAQAIVLTSACHHFNISGIIAYNNIGGSSGTPDVYIDSDCYDINVSKVVGYEAGSTDYFATVMTGAYNITLRDLRVHARASGVLSLGASIVGLIVDGVTGFKVKARGTTTLAAGSTSMTIAHGLSVTPNLQDVRVQQNGATATPLYLSAADATNITITTQTSNTADAPFTWSIDSSWS